MRSNRNEHEIENPEIPEDSIWWEDFWIYIIIAVAGFLFSLVIGILGRDLRHFMRPLWKIISFQ